MYGPEFPNTRNSRLTDVAGSRATFGGVLPVHTPGDGLMTETVSSGNEFGFPSCLECDPVAASLQLRGEAVVHSKDKGIPGEVGIVANDMLIVG